MFNDKTKQNDIISLFAEGIIYPKNETVISYIKKEEDLLQNLIANFTIDFDSIWPIGKTNERNIENNTNKFAKSWKGNENTSKTFRSSSSRKFENDSVLISTPRMTRV